MKTVISQQYEHRSEHWSFPRTSGLRRHDFRPAWMHLISADAIVLLVCVVGLIVGLIYVGVKQ